MGAYICVAKKKTENEEHVRACVRACVRDSSKSHFSVNMSFCWKPKRF